MQLTRPLLIIDLESTGVDPMQDRIVQLGVSVLHPDGTVNPRGWQRLINPTIPIPAAATAVHHITDEMVRGKPKVAEIIPSLLKFIGKDIIIGHGIALDLAFIATAAKRHQIPCTLLSHPTIDTLRMARLYGESPVNSLAMLRHHFNIPDEGAHRAMNA